MIKKKSKRLTCHKKFKIAKKVREHNRKQRKEAKQAGNSKFKQAKKDPGVPNCPWKEEVLHEAERRKKLAEEMKEKQKRKRLEELMKRRKIGTATSEKDLVKNAEKRAKEFAAATTSTLDAATIKDPSRNYIREFNKVVEAADVIIQVLDARDPIRSRCSQVESSVIAAGSSKRLVLLLNKVDLVPREVVEKWIKYLRNEFPTLAFKSSTQNQKENLARSKVTLGKASDQLLQSSQCLGADTLMKLLANYSRSLDTKTAIRVGVVGFPNVGKSSVINSLKRAQACEVGAVPGMTKMMQEVKLDKNIKMLDSPGVVMSKSVDPVERVLRNCTRLDLAGVDASSVVDHILQRCPAHQLRLQYNIPSFKDTTEFLTLMAQKMGRLKKGGIPDIDKAAYKVIDDWNSGKIRYYTHPPEIHTMPHHLTANIVNSMASPFDLSQVDHLTTLTLNSLKPIDHAKDVIMQSSTALSAGDLEEAKIDDDDDDDDNDEWEDEEEKEDNDMVDELEEQQSKLKANEDLIVAGPSPAVSKKSLMRKSKGQDVAQKLAEKQGRKVQFKNSNAASVADSAEGAQANVALKKQFKKMKKERKKNAKVAEGLADGLDKALASLGSGQPQIGKDDDYDFSVL